MHTEKRGGSARRGDRLRSGWTEPGTATGGTGSVRSQRSCRPGRAPNPQRDKEKRGAPKSAPFPLCTLSFAVSSNSRRKFHEAYRCAETNHEFRRLYSKGKSAVSPYFAIYCRKTKRPNSRLGITTGLKLGNAVKRNRARRRIRELYRTNESRLLPGYDIVVVARTRVIYGSYGELERSFLQLMRKLGICPPRGSAG